MHEFGITQMLVENVVKQAEEHNASKVIQVEIEIGEFTFVNFEQIEFCYSTLIPETILKDSKLLLTLKKGTVECESCGYTGPVNTINEDESLHSFGLLSFTCPDCDSYTKIIDGKDFVIKRMKMQA